MRHELSGGVISKDRGQPFVAQQDASITDARRGYAGQRLFEHVAIAVLGPVLLRVGPIDLRRDVPREPRDEQGDERDPDHGKPGRDQDAIPAEQLAQSRIEQTD